MSEATVRGIVHLIEETKSYGQSGFRKRLVVLEQDKGRFTNYVPVEFVHEGCDDANQLSVGDDVEIAYRLSGRKWQKDAKSEVKFFLSAEATGFKLLKKTGESTSAAPPTVYTESEVAPDDYPDSDEEIPF